MKNKYIIENNDNNPIIFHKYASLINQDLNQLLFLFKGKYLNLKNKLNILNYKSIIIFVFNKKKRKENKEKIKDIICPECKKLALLNINGNSFIIDSCKKNHNYILTLDSFIYLQKIDELKIKCHKCGNNKLYYNDLIYINDEGIYICPLCLNSNKIDAINYKFKFYICMEHNKNYESYCYKCKINLCSKCEEKHKYHQIILFKKIKPSIERIEEIKRERIKIDNYKEELNELKNFFNEICEDNIEEINNYIKIYDYIIDSINNMSNYESIKNILNFKTDKFMEEIDDFLNKNQIYKLLNIINKYENKKNELTIIYNNEIHGEIKLFGSEFVKNNKGNCYLLINNKKSELIEKIQFKDYFDNQYLEKIIIKLIENKNKNKNNYLLGNNDGITNMSNMFYECSSLLFLPDISKWNTSNITNMSNMLYECASLSFLSDISKWNTRNVSDMSNIFFECSSLTSLPDISKWNTYNITNMSCMFSRCLLLASLPDISKWSTNKVIDMSGLFYECSSLSSLPDISKWNTNNVDNMSYMFYGCSSLSNLPDISNWNTSNIINMSNMFKNCLSLASLSDISKWNTNAVKDMSEMFYGCSLLSSLPDISKWNTKAVKDMSYMFFGCLSLSSLPNISEWNTNNVNNIRCMFSGCSSLSSLPDISKWNIDNVTDITFMFMGCKNTLQIPEKFRDNLK